jgi:ABC-type molybdate transport system substrate-binding protein
MNTMLQKLLSSLAALALAPVLFVPTSSAQVLVSGLGGTYSQDFNSLASSSSQDTNWVDNATLPGWYASQRGGGAITGYRLSAGNVTSSALYSYGITNDTDRALGSQAGSTPADFAYGVRLMNDTAEVMTNLMVTYTGEQWRRANTLTQTLAFSYFVSSSEITNADVRGTNYAWIPFTALDFNTPNVGAAGALNGNDPTNQQAFSNVELTGVQIQPGQEFFFRWRDMDDTGTDNAVALDDLTISFTSIVFTTNAPVIIAEPQSRTNDAGTVASFTVAVAGSDPLSFQWWKNTSELLVDGGNVSGATNKTLALSNVKKADEGTYSCVITNLAGSTNSAGATLTVIDPAIATQPFNSTNIVGDRQTFSVTARGTTPFAYQWRQDNSDVLDATNSFVLFTSIDASNAGNYTVVVSNSFGAITSSVAALTILSTPSTHIGQWNFNSDPPDAAVASGVTTPTIGSGSAALVGATTTETFSAGASQDPAQSGNDNSGWNISDFPSGTTNNKTAGVQFNFSTSGYQQIMLTWRERHSSTASRYTRVQYSTDGIDFNDLNAVTTTNADTFNLEVVDLSAIPAANDNPNFAFRIVTEFESTATGAGGANYVATGSGSSYSGGQGTIRFDWVNIFGNPTNLVTSLPLNIQRSGSDVILTWTDPAFALQAAPAATGTYTNVPGATSPFTNAITGDQQFFRLKN